MQLRSMLVGATVASALWVVPAFAEDLVFTLDNQSSAAIQELHISTLDQNNWGDDILGQDVLPGGQKASVTLSNTNGICEFDMRLVYEDGSVTDERKINLCDLDNDTYTVSD